MLVVTLVYFNIFQCLCCSPECTWGIRKSVFFWTRDTPQNPVVCQGLRMVSHVFPIKMIESWIAILDNFGMSWMSTGCPPFLDKPWKTQNFADVNILVHAQFLLQATSSSSPRHWSWLSHCPGWQVPRLRPWGGQRLVAGFGAQFKPDSNHFNTSNTCPMMSRRYWEICRNLHWQSLQRRHHYGTCDCPSFSPSSASCNNDACFTGCPSSLADNACGDMAKNGR